MRSDTIKYSSLSSINLNFPQNPLWVPSLKTPQQSFWRPTWGGRRGFSLTALETSISYLVLSLKLYPSITRTILCIHPLPKTIHPSESGLKTLELHPFRIWSTWYFDTSQFYHLVDSAARPSLALWLLETKKTSSEDSDGVLRARSIRKSAL